MTEEAKTAVQLFEEGEQMLEAVIDGETTSNNLENHHYGAMLVSSATVIGRAYDKLPESYVNRAIELLNRSCGVLKEYIKSTQDDVASLFLRFNQERLQRLSEYAR